MPVALVTVESRNEVLAIDLDSGKVAARATVAADPQNVVVGNAAAVVVSARGAAVTLLDPRTLRVRAVIRGFGAPHVPALHPGGRFAFVTDDARGTLTVIDLRRARRVRTLAVGLGAHHLAFSPDGRRLWIALGERARTIVVVDTSRAARPRVLSRFDPGFPAHDLAFSPDGARVWVTADRGNSVGVFTAVARRLVFRVPAGPPPQHVAFGLRFAYLTSGYGSRIELVEPRTGLVLRSAAVSYGSFNVATVGGVVVTSSLLRGTLTELTDRLRPLHQYRAAPVARDLALTVW
jgi:DNA-binding beta-propeller fold protein YncE